AYLLVSETGETAADERLPELAQGRTFGVALELGTTSEQRAAEVLGVVTGEGYSAWVFDKRGRLVTQRFSDGYDFRRIAAWHAIVREVLKGRRYVESQPEGVTIVGTPIYREGELDGAVIARAERPPELQEAIEAV